MRINRFFVFIVVNYWLQEDERDNESIEIPETFKKQTNYKDRPVGYVFNQILMQFNGLF